MKEVTLLVLMKKIAFMDHQILLFVETKQSIIPKNYSLLPYPPATCFGFYIFAQIASIVVIDYIDNATGTMQETKDGGGYFTDVTLHPTVVVSDASMIEKANKLHHEANKLCYIANSCNFPIHHKPNCKAANA